MRLNFALKKADYFSHVSKVTLQSLIMFTVCALYIMFPKWYLNSLIFLSKTHYPSLVIRKKNQANCNRGASYNIFDLKVIKNKENLKNCRQDKCNVVFWMGFWNRKRTPDKN